MRMGHKHIAYSFMGAMYAYGYPMGLGGSEVIGEPYFNCVCEINEDPTRRDRAVR